MIPFTPESLDEALGRDVPVLLVYSSFDANAARETIRARRPLLLVEVPSGAFGDVVEALRPHVQILVDQLMRAPEVSLGIDLRQIIDDGLYTPKLGTLFESFWEARFDLRDGLDPASTVTAMWKDTFEEQSPWLRSDALLFWITLLHQNADPTVGPVVLVLAGSELEADTWTFIRTAEYWRVLGSPLRVITDAAAIN